MVFFADRNLGKIFPGVLRGAGFSVELHDDHFHHTIGDEEWIPQVAALGWIAISHDRSIRRRPNERDAVLNSGLRLLVVVGKAPFPVLAEHFVATRPAIERFLRSHPIGPWIAGVYSPSPADATKKLKPRGRVELWLP